ncbi:hypothetical protein KKH82_00340 [Patescibacteria group bacterium]|nr:hypothetical protein [Patescibacteria group bacterium]
MIPLSSAADISNAISVEQVVESQGNYYILAPKADVKYKRTMKFEAGINSIKVYRDNEQIGVIKVDRDATSANLTIGKDGLLPLSQNTDLFNMKGLDQYNREIFNKQIVVMNNQETFYAFIKQINAQIQVQKSNVGLTNACETDADCGEN